MPKDQLNVGAERCCRECLNKKYHVRLSRQNCKYWRYPAPCSDCGEVRHIVTNLSFWGKWKLFWKKLFYRI